MPMERSVGSLGVHFNILSLHVHFLLLQMAFLVVLNLGFSYTDGNFCFLPEHGINAVLPGAHISEQICY